MKTHILALLFLGISTLSLNAQSPDWKWAKKAGGTGGESASGISADINGNIIVAGCFNSTDFVIGSYTLHNTENTTYDIYVAKYDSLGNVLWAKSFAGNDNDDIVSGVTTDGSGNIYLCGYYRGTTITFGTCTLNNSNPYWAESFLVKLDQDGSAQWAKKASSVDGENYAQGLSCDAAGSIYYSGYFSGQSLLIEGVTLYNACEYVNDLFIAKYNSNGQLKWARRAGGNDEEGILMSMCADSAGNSYMTGSFMSSAVVFGGTTIYNSDPSAFHYDVFLTKYNTTGSVVWAKALGSSDEDDFVFAIGSDNQGNVFLSWANTLTKFNTAGDSLWSLNFNGGNSGASIICQQNGTIYLSGLIYGTSVIIGSDTLINHNSANYDFFICKLDTTGNAIWAKSAGGTGNDAAYITAKPSGDIYLAGYFASPSILIGNTTLTNSGGSDVLVARLNRTPTSVYHFETNDKYLHLYPNPFNQSAVLDFDNSSDNSSLVIYNIHGDIVRTVEGIRDNKIIIERKGLNNGLYFFQIHNTKNITGSGKFVIE